MTFKQSVHKILGNIEEMLVQKNAEYGNSALQPCRVFSKAGELEQIYVRIDDKLSRISRQREGGICSISEDTITDLIGYLVLLKVATQEEKR